MKVKVNKPFPKARARMKRLGERLKLARLRRKFAVEVVCARMPCSRATWQRIEAGDPTVAMGRYERALEIMGLADDFERLAADDELGRRLQDLSIKQRVRAPRNTKSKTAAPSGVSS
jgi:transcriptional regulator with XRE-family HTH domain